MSGPTVKPDWLSWTVYPQAPPGYQMNDLWRGDWFNKQYGRFGLLVETKATKTVRKPYNRKHDILDNLGMLFCNPKLDYATVELTGRGCTMKMQFDEFEMIAEQALETCTRFDVAIDFDVDDTPFEFAQAGIAKRIQSKSFVQSPDGETVYIGSPNSDYMARVYKYNEPHERAGLLRVELVARRKPAKIALKLWLEQGPIPAIAFMAKPFNFQHHLWQSGAWMACVVDSKIETARSEQKTKKWLLKQVKPALLRLASEQALDAPFMAQLVDGLPFVSVEYQAGGQTIKDTRVLPLRDVDGTELPFKGLL